MSHDICPICKGFTIAENEVCDGCKNTHETKITHIGIPDRYKTALMTGDTVHERKIKYRNKMTHLTPKKKKRK